MIFVFYQKKHKNDFEDNTSKSYSSWINVWIEIPCSGKTLIGQIIVVHRSSIFENSKALGKQVQVKVMEGWSRKKISSDKIELAFVTIFFDICGKVFLKQVELKFFFLPKFFSRIVVKNQKFRNLSIETVVIIDLQIINL